MDIPKTSHYGWLRLRLSIAIAIAERGSHEILSGSVKNNNPGDIEDSEGRLMNYPDVLSGWRALQAQIDTVYAGSSKHYNVQMTIVEFARVYTGMDDPAAWSAIVAGMLGVDINTKFCDL